MKYFEIKLTNSAFKYIKSIFFVDENKMNEFCSYLDPNHYSQNIMEIPLMDAKSNFPIVNGKLDSSHEKFIINDCTLEWKNGILIGDFYQEEMNDK